MCSYFLQRTMNNYQGDLLDIIRASGRGGGNGIGINTTTTTTTSKELPAVTDNWQFQYDYPPVDLLENFGHPFYNLRDPILHELDITGSSFSSSSSGPTNMIMNPNIEDQKIHGDEMNITRPCNNIFSRMLQISSSNPNVPVSPCDSPLLGSPNSGSNDHMINPDTSKGCLLENSAMQISSQRIIGIKRRKSQPKKVVCIPAPAAAAAANSRPTGEIVPSDLWAWRKYGQKPIKGSPYPRGYYRCSSSKGCSAKKQVERSRANPNMLVITYTSEHNHLRPTQRNALAGSTRTQPAKNTSSSSSSKNTSSHKEPSVKEEAKESTNTNNTDIASPSIVTINEGPQLKEEMEDLIDKEIEMHDINEHFGEGFPHSYRLVLPDSNRSEDFFADLGEIEADPLNLLFAQGFARDEERGNKALDPFSFYDWTGNNNNTQFGEAKRGS